MAERRKFRLTGAGGRVLARFAGLGAIGEEKLAAARLLHAAGLTPEPLALRRGFLLERWIEGDRLDTASASGEPPVGHLGRYLGFRARALQARDEDGASLAALGHMAITNATELGGDALGDLVSEQLAGIDDLAGLVPVRVDGRLHAWEWLRRPDGSLCKTDALDHAVAHDLIGCQDIAWDVAGAAVEFALSEQDAALLRAAVEAEAGRAVDPRAVAAFRLCYAAFQAASWSMIGERGSPQVAALVDRYVADLRRSAGAIAPAQTAA